MPARLIRGMRRITSSRDSKRQTHAIDRLEPRVLLAGDVVSSLRITELNYNPDGNNAEAEFIELKNIGPETINLAGVHFTVGIPCTFAPVDLRAGESCIAVRGSEGFISRGYPYYGSRFDGNLKIAAQYGEEALSNGGEQLVLCDAAGTVIQDFTYDDNGPWPTAADGNSYTLVFSDPTRPVADWSTASAWRTSRFPYGTPGADETPTPLGSIVVNEVLSHTHLSPVGTWVEFYNPTGSDIDISGWWLSNGYGLFRYAIPSGTVIHAHDYVAFDQANDFGNSGLYFAEGYSSVVLSSANAFGIFSGFAIIQELPPSPPEVAIGQISLTYGGCDFGFLASASKGQANAAALVGPVVMNEMLCDPISTSEYIELHNISDDPVPLFDPNAHYRTWMLDGVGYAFPENTTLEPDEYILVVPIAPAAYRAAHPEVADSVRIFGPYGGFIENNGDTITLMRPADTALDPFGFYYTADSVNSGPLPHNTAIPTARRSGGYSDDPANSAQEITALGSPGRPNFSLLSGDGTPHTWTLRTIGADFRIYEDRSGPLIFSAPLASLPAITVLGNSSDDRLFLETSGHTGFPIPPGGLTFDAGGHSTADSLNLIGVDAAVSFTPASATSGILTFPTGQTLTFLNTEPVDLTGFSSLTVNMINSTPNTLTVVPAPGSLQIIGSAGSTAIHPLTVTGLSTLTLVAPAGANTLNITGGSFNLNTIGPCALALSNNASVKLLTRPRFSALSLANSARLDLLDHDLILDYAGASPLNAIRQWICNGQQGSASASIVTSRDQFSPGHYAALAPVDNATIHQTTWNGQPLTASPNFSQVIIKYTCRGDTNLNGLVDANDYANIIANMGHPGTSWLFGDLNNDGMVTPDDCAEVAANLAGVGASLELAAPPSAAALVESSAHEASSKIPAAKPKVKHSAPLRRAKPRRHR